MTTKVGWYFIYITLSVSPYFGVSILVTTRKKMARAIQIPKYRQNGGGNHCEAMHFN